MHLGDIWWKVINLNNWKNILKAVSKQMEWLLFWHSIITQWFSGGFAYYSNFGF
jgi:hypothetical protein